MAQPVLINGQWREANSGSTFQAENPAEAVKLSEEYPVSTWADCDEALDAAVMAAEQLRAVSGEQIAAYLEAYANRIEARKDDIVQAANLETGLPVSPRLADGELPRTTNQLRQAAAAARDGSWAHATIDSATGIRSYLAPIGPVCVFGPNNFPLAFGSVSGGDFAAAIAAGNPVIGKANSSHPATTRIFAEEALLALEETELPKATVQLLYRLDHADGERLVSDPRVGATGYTGSRSAGLALKRAADSAGKPIYLELSSVNPVVVLPGALAERGSEIVDEFSGSCLMGTGQFCTNPGMVLLLKGDGTDQFIEGVRGKFEAASAGILLSSSVRKSLEANLNVLKEAGATALVGDHPVEESGYRYANTLLQVSGEQFLAAPETMQTEAFGNCSLFVVADDTTQAAAVLRQLEGNLTGCFYSSSGDDDDAHYAALEPIMRAKVGRLLNDKMPTGVAVSAAMNHGGPYPATGHPGFTAVGIPGSLFRFAMLQCYDNVRAHRLPELLRDSNPTGNTWRLIDGQWSQESLS